MNLAIIALACFTILAAATRIGVNLEWDRERTQTWVTRRSVGFVHNSFASLEAVFPIHPWLLSSQIVFKKKHSSPAAPVFIIIDRGAVLLEKKKKITDWSDKRSIVFHPSSDAYLQRLPRNLSSRHTQKPIRLSPLLSSRLPRFQSQRPFNINQSIKSQ